MKNNKKIIITFSVFAIIILVLGLASVYIQNKNIVSLPKITEEKPETVLSITNEVHKNNGVNKLSFYITPKNEKFTLAAFTFKASISNKGIYADSQIIKNEKLTQDAWSFPIFRLVDFNQQTNQIGIEVAGFRLGNTPYIIEDKTELFSVTLNENADSEVTLSLDNQNTQFFASDAVTELKY